MADKGTGRGGTGKDEPSLELPSFFGGRKKRKETPQTPVEDTSAETVSTTEPAPEDPTEAPHSQPESRRHSTLAERFRSRRPEPTDPEPGPAAGASTQTQVMEAKPTQGSATATGSREADTAAAAGTGSGDVAEEPVTTDPPRRRGAGFTLPALDPTLATAITGLVAGLLLVLLTFATLQGCSAVRGTASCGGTGFLGLLVIVGVLTWLAALLLGQWKVPEPGSTALLGMGLLIVIALLFLSDLLFEWWMIIVIPLLALVTFSLAHLVGARYGDEPRRT